MFSLQNQQYQANDVVKQIDFRKTFDFSKQLAWMFKTAN